MDGLFRLFCGCCGLQGGEQEPPYDQLRHDSVTPVRDPPIQCLNGQGFSNPIHDFYPAGFDATDQALPQHPPHHHRGAYSDSPSPPSADLDDDVADDEHREKELLDNIVENTQHSIIAVGQTDVDGMIMMDTHNREKNYRIRTQKMAAAPAAVNVFETAYEFELETSQHPIPIPIRYDDVSSTIEASPIDRVPFSCPDFNQIKLAKPMGTRNPQFLAEHPDLKRAGRSQGISQSQKQKITEVLDEIHQGVIAVEVEPKMDLIISMDF